MNKKIRLLIILIIAVGLGGIGFIATAGLSSGGGSLDLAKSAADRIHDISIASHVYSHRGASSEEIEHTEKAYDRAIELGSINIEQDVVVSKDGTLYVSHDRDALHIAGVDKKFADMTDQEIEQLRTADGQKILKLSEVFDRYGRSVNYIVELKSRDSRSVDAFIDLVTENVNVNNVVVQCFNLDVLKRIDRVFPDMKKVYLCDSQRAFDRGLDATCVDIMGANKSLMNSKNVAAAHEHGKLMGAWVLDTSDEITQAIGLGVDVYFTNETERALKLERELRMEQWLRLAEQWV